MGLNHGGLLALNTNTVETGREDASVSLSLFREFCMDIALVFGALFWSIVFQIGLVFIVLYILCIFFG